jgi:lysophospholipase
MFSSSWTLTTPRGRSLSYQLINASEGGIAYTWSSIALSPDFMAGTMPLPIVIADERPPGQTIIRQSTL